MFFILNTLKKRTCKDCKLTKRADCFGVVDRSGNRRGVCKSCYSYSRNPNAWNKNVIRKKLYAKNKRCCSMCYKIKDLSFFPNDYSGRVYNNKKSYCLTCAYRMKNDYVNRNKDKKASWDKTYRTKNKDKLNEKFYISLRNNPQKKIAHLLRTGVNKVLKRKGQTKVGSVTESIGCLKEQLVKHIEDQFYPNKETGELMTWSNHGVNGWHIDHIRPLCSVDLENPKDFAEVSHYLNLQPLWSKENLSKSGKWDKE